MSFKRGFKTRDSALSYFVNQLDNLDKRLYEPLVSVTWSRDIPLRAGVTMSQESTSFIRSSFAAPGSLSVGTGSNGGNMPWISAETNAITGVDINGQRIVTPLRLLARELSYTSVELERSQLTGQPIDLQKMDAMNTLYQMNTDQMVYIGSADVSATGLLNNASTYNSQVVQGVSGSRLWSAKTPDEILSDVNTLLNSVWSNSAFAICPSTLLVPPAQFAYICSQKVSSAGNVSILKFLQENSISTVQNGKLDISPVKWQTGRGTGGADQMSVYTKDESRIRMPMVPVRRETAYYSGIRYTAPYLWAFGEIEFVYPETFGSAYGI